MNDRARQPKPIALLRLVLPIILAVVGAPAKAALRRRDAEGIAGRRAIPPR